MSPPLFNVTCSKAAIAYSMSPMQQPCLQNSCYPPNTIPTSLNLSQYVASPLPDGINVSSHSQKAMCITPLPVSPLPNSIRCIGFSLFPTLYSYKHKVRIISLLLSPRNIVQDYTRLQRRSWNTPVSNLLSPSAILLGNFFISLCACRGMPMWGVGRRGV